MQLAFAPAARKRVRRTVKTPPPFSLRLSTEERDKLEAAAAGMPLGSYIKTKLFGGDLSARRTRGSAPVKDHAALAQVLGMLGNMRLASNLNQLARSANIGTLPLAPEVEEELALACAAVIAMRAELLRALGYEAENRP
ncbi:hypothetical protein FNJ84_13435 [Paracoccus sp. M683]|nr:hypothetical protein FNJ84_13435 [Paracoccus sp. M683]